MKHSFFLTLLFILLLTNSFAADDCKQTQKSVDELIKTIRDSFKEKRDFNIELHKLEKIVTENSSCITYEKLKITDNELAKFRKFTFAPDQSFNLEEKKCQELKVDTSHMPKNNDQSYLGWCYAFTAADLLSFQEKKAFSSYDLALQSVGLQDFLNNRSHVEYSDLGGNPIKAILASYTNNKKGVCLEENFIKGDALKWAEISDMVENLAKSPKKLSLIMCENKFHEQNILGEIPLDVLKILDKLSAGKRTAALLDTQCKKRQVIKTQYVLYEMDMDKNTKEEIILKLDKILALGEPFSVGYSSELLKKGVNYVGSADHASTVVGRRFNKTNGQCEYEIKNSWGDDGDIAAQSLGFDKGHYWIPRTSLKNNIEVGWYIKKPM